MSVNQQDLDSRASIVSSPDATVEELEDIGMRVAEDFQPQFLAHICAHPNMTDEVRLKMFEVAKAGNIQNRRLIPFFFNDPGTVMDVIKSGENDMYILWALVSNPIISGYSEEELGRIFDSNAVTGTASGLINPLLIVKSVKYAREQWAQTGVTSSSDIDALWNVAFEKATAEMDM